MKLLEREQYHLWLCLVYSLLTEHRNQMYFFSSLISTFVSQISCFVSTAINSTKNHVTISLFKAKTHFKTPNRNLKVGHLHFYQLAPCQQKAPIVCSAYSSLFWHFLPFRGWYPSFNENISGEQLLNRVIFSSYWNKQFIILKIIALYNNTECNISFLWKCPNEPLSLCTRGLLLSINLEMYQRLLFLWPRLILNHQLWGCRTSLQKLIQVTETGRGPDPAVPLPSAIRAFLECCSWGPSSCSGPKGPWRTRRVSKKRGNPEILLGPAPPCAAQTPFCIRVQ